MKIVICGSMSSSTLMVRVGRELAENGHEVVLPEHTEKYASGSLPMESSYESTKNKIEQNLIKRHFEKIKCADAVLVINPEKGSVNDYIGGNAFLEMGFAYVLEKKIFILNNIPNVLYKDEILAMQPMVLKGDISKFSE